ncbi:hypothetical protein D3C75_522400 [compost metagenome]
MNTDEQHAAFGLLHRMDLIYAADVAPALNTPGWPEPGNAGFHQAKTHRLKVFIQIDLALFRRFMGEGELKIATGNSDAAFHKTPGEFAEATPKSVNHWVGEQGN